MFKEKLVMKKFTFYVLLVLMTCGAIFSCEIAFSQAHQTENGNAQYVKGITPDRARSLAGGVIGLVSLAIGWSAKRRSMKDSGKVLNLAKLALTLGLIAAALSVFHLLNTAGAVFGSGSGKAGAIVALILSSIGIALSCLVLLRKNK